MDREDGTRRIAIACQGGGSHTAFTAGVLRKLLPEEKYEIVALSGTSGGAICATLAWYALLRKDRAKAVELLDSFWRDNSAKAIYEKLWNDWFVWVNRLQGSVVLPTVSPYSTPTSSWAQEQLKKMLEKHIKFEDIKGPTGDSSPMLLLGAADVRSGEFKAFNSRRDRINADMILASAAIPTLFRAVHTNGGVYWDGLFSQNPPVRELPHAGPDEIWVIQINPERRAEEPRSVTAIMDRRNELSGNLSLYQEMHFIEKINELVDKGLLSDSDRYKSKYKLIRVRRIEMSKPLDTASKLDRSPSFIRGLIDYGEEQAGEFLTAMAFEAAWRDRDLDAVAGFFAEDGVVELVSPFFGRAFYRGKGQIRSFVKEHLAENFHVDSTKHQVAGNKVAWTIKASSDRSGDSVEGTAEAVFRDRKIESFTFETQSRAELEE